MIAGLANGRLAFFSHTTSGWDLQSKEEMSLGSPPVQPIRCCLAKGEGLWVGYWNKIHMINITSQEVEVSLKDKDKHIHNSLVFVLLFTPLCPLSLSLCLSPSHSSLSQKSFPVSERSEQQVRFLCAAGSGVWASCRLDPTLRLFDWATGRPLQEVDLSPMVTKALGKNVFLPSFT